MGHTQATECIEMACSIQEGKEDRCERSGCYSYLIHSLSHKVLFHGDVVANQLLHGTAEKAIVEQFIQVLLMLCGAEPP